MELQKRYPDLSEKFLKEAERLALSKGSETGSEKLDTSLVADAVRDELSSHRGHDVAAYLEKAKAISTFIENEFSDESNGAKARNDALDAVKQSTRQMGNDIAGMAMTIAEAGKEPKGSAKRFMDRLQNVQNIDAPDLKRQLLDSAKDAIGKGGEFEDDELHDAMERVLHEYLEDDSIEDAPTEEA